jgi:hypothetical protein
LLELGEQAAHFVQLRAESFHAPKLGGDLRQRAGGVLVQPTDAALARFDLSAERARPRFGLLVEAAQLGLRRRSAVEHLAEPFDQGEVERLGHVAAA